MIMMIGMKVSLSAEQLLLVEKWPLLLLTLLFVNEITVISM
jgi:hypothetical protein